MDNKYSDIYEEIKDGDALEDELLSVDKKNTKIRKSSMKRTIILASIALLLIAALVAGFMIFSKEEEKDDKNIVVLYDYQANQIEKIEIDNHLKNDKIVLSPFMNGTELQWNVQGQKYDNVNQNKIKSIVQYSRHLETLYVLDYDSSKLGEYGLQEPATTVKLTFNDGKKITVDFGNIYGKNEGAYVRVHGDNQHIYVVTDYARMYFTYALSDILTLPSLSRTTVSASIVSVIRKDRSVATLAYVPDPIYGTEAWYLIEPTDSETDSNAVDEYFTNIGALALSSYFAEKVGEDVTFYGFDKPELEFQSYDIDNKLLDHLVVGKLVEGTTDTYYCVLMGDGEDIKDTPVYLIKKDQMQLVNVNTVKLASPYLLALNINWLRSGKITLGGTEYKLDIERQLQYDDTGKVLYNEDGSENTKNTYYLNGTKLDELQFKHFYSKFLFLYIEGIKPQDAELGEALCSYSLNVVIPVQDTETGKYENKEIEYAGTYYKISENYAVLDSNQSENAVFTVRIRSIEEVNKAIQLLMEGRMPTT